MKNDLNIIKFLNNNKGMNQADIANELKVSQQLISRMKNSDIELLSPERKKQLIKVAGIYWDMGKVEKYNYYPKFVRKQDKERSRFPPDASIDPKGRIRLRHDDKYYVAKVDCINTEWAVFAQSVENEEEWFQFLRDIAQPAELPSYKYLGSKEKDDDEFIKKFLIGLVKAGFTFSRTCTNAKNNKNFNVFLKRFLGTMFDFQSLYQDFKFSLTYENAPLNIRSFYDKLETLHSHCVDSAVIQTIADMDPLTVDFIDGENLKYITKISLNKIDESVDYWRTNCNHYYWKCDENLFNKIELKGWIYSIERLVDSLNQLAIDNDLISNEGQIHDASANSETTSSTNIYAEVQSSSNEKIDTSSWSISERLIYEKLQSNEKLMQEILTKINKGGA